MKVTADIANLARVLLPVHKRQSNRIKIINTLLAPLYSLFEEFLLWQKMIRSFQVTSQVMVLESYLTEKYGEQVIIETAQDGGVSVSLREEGGYYIDLGDDFFKDIYLRGEAQTYFDNCDYVVHAPAKIPIETVRKDVERFRRAGKKVIIKQS